MSNSSFDIGDATGAESKAYGYIPGLPLKVFFCIGANNIERCNAAIAHTVRFVGELDPRGTPEDAEFCVVVPYHNQRIGSTMVKELTRFYSRFGTEARLYVYDEFEQKLVFRGEDYFTNLRRLHS